MNLSRALVEIQGRRLNASISPACYTTAANDVSFLRAACLCAMQSRQPPYGTAQPLNLEGAVPRLALQGLPYATQALACRCDQHRFWRRSLGALLYKGRVRKRFCRRDLVRNQLSTRRLRQARRRSLFTPRPSRSPCARSAWSSFASGTRVLLQTQLARTGCMSDTTCRNCVCWDPDAECQTRSARAAASTWQGGAVACIHVSAAGWGAVATARLLSTRVPSVRTAATPAARSATAGCNNATSTQHEVLISAACPKLQLESKSRHTSGHPHIKQCHSKE